MVLALVAHPALMAQDEVEYKMEIGGAIGVNHAVNDLNSKLFGAMGLTGGGMLRFVLNPAHGGQNGADVQCLEQ